MHQSVVFCVVMGVLALRPEIALSQQKSFKDELIGSWTIVSNDNIGVDGEKRQIFGPNPKGLFILGADGRYALVVVNPDRPKFKGASRLEGTSEENKAVIAGTVASFGT
jgi:Lipocalin-like domain